MEQTSTIRAQSRVLATNKVIRNTYILLAMTLATSAFTALYAMSSGVGMVNPWMVLLIFIGMPFLISSVRNSVWALPLTFLFTGFMGYVLGPILGHYMALPNGPQIVAAAFGTTAAVFLGLSGYALTTRKDFSFMSGFLFVGLLVALGAIILNIFLQIPALSLTISAAVVLMMSAMILYDTSRMIHGGETSYIMMTVSLYANIYVLFLHLLNLFSFFGSND